MAKTTFSPTVKFRRRHYFIDREFQGVFLLRFLLSTLAAAGVAGWLVYRSFDSALEDQMYSAHVVVANTGELLRGRLMLVNSVVATVLLAAAIVFVWRVARGCGFAFKRARTSLARVAQGDLTVVVWAKSQDRLDGLFREINASIIHARKCAIEARGALQPVNSDRSDTIPPTADTAACLRACATALRKMGS
jgi:methyl-accepting chemotaxis protein